MPRLTEKRPVIDSKNRCKMNVLSALTNMYQGTTQANHGGLSKEMMCSEQLHLSGSVRQMGDDHS